MSIDEISKRLLKGEVVRMTFETYETLTYYVNKGFYIGFPELIKSIINDKTLEVKIV